MHARASAARPVFIMTSPTSEMPHERVARWTSFFPELDSRRAIDELTLTVSGRTLEQFTSRDTAEVNATISGDRVEAEDPFSGFLLSTVLVDVSGMFDDLARSAVIADPNTLIAELKRDLGQRLQMLAIRTLVRELHELRDGGQLVGATSSERFDSFCEQLWDPAWSAGFWIRYPTLLRRLQMQARLLVNFVSEIVSHFETDAALISTLTGERAGGRLVSITVGSGDTHRGGRSVSIVQLESGARVVYKPRSLKVEAAFNQLVARANDRWGIDLLTGRVLDVGDHGWMEFLETARPTTAAQFDRYYEDIGRLTALLYFLAGSDMHYENVLAASTRPVLIDLETLLTGRIPEANAYAEGAAARVADAILENSAMTIGILPSVLSAGAGQNDADMGGVGFQPGGLSPLRSFVLLEQGTDQMHISFERLELSLETNVPILEDWSAVNARDAIVAGFSEMYSAAEESGELASWVIDLFSGVHVRYVHSPTFFYAQLLRMATHPDFMSNPVDREVLFHRVAMLHANSHPAVARAEIREMLLGDVPYFTRPATSRELLDSDGRTLGELFPISPLDTALARIRSLDETDRRRQLNLIEASFTHRLPPDSDRSNFHFSTSPAKGSSGTKTGIQAAIAYGDQLLDSTIHGEDESYPPAWIGTLVTSSDSKLWRPGNLTYDLYGGISGIALFLSSLGKVSGLSRFTDVAASVLRPLSGLLREDVLSQPGYSVGGYGGASGILYAVVRHAQDVGDSHLLAETFTRLATLRGMIAADEQLDIIGGSAGVLALATRMMSLADTPEQHQIATITAETARDRLFARHPTLAADAEAEPDVHSGYGHGIAGLLPGLARLGDDAALTAALAGIHAMFDSDVRDWSRSRSDGRQSFGWCHGSPGILGALLQVVDARPDLREQVRPGIEAAIVSTVEHGFGNNITYCHGDLGNLESLEYALARGFRADLADRVTESRHRLSRNVPEFLTTRSSKYSYSDSLLVGRGGAAYSLLGSETSSKPPSFLWFELDG